MLEFRSSSSMGHSDASTGITIPSINVIIIINFGTEFTNIKTSLISHNNHKKYALKFSHLPGLTMNK